MLENIMKAVKRKVKKKNLNVTTAAVVGFLLSCPMAMGEGLEITQETGKEILFNDEIYDKATHLFEENTFENNVYINNTRIEDSDSGGNTGCGLFIMIEEDFGLVINNNSLILGNRKEYNQDGFGIWNYESKTEKINNNGIILGKGQRYGRGILNYATINNIENQGIIYGNSASAASGIQNERGGVIGTINNSGKIMGVLAMESRGIYNTETITDIKNTGIIYGNGNTGFGIKGNSGVIKMLENLGFIIGIGNNGEGHGISNYNNYFEGPIEKLENTGKIMGISVNDSGYGVAGSNLGSEPTIIDNLGMIIGRGKSFGRGLLSESVNGDKINNFGIIYGNTHAIDTNSVGEPVGSNYGLLLNKTEGENVVNGITIENAGSGDTNIKNYGIVFKVESEGKYDVSYRYDGSEDIDVNMFSKERDMKVKNASTSVSGSESILGNTYENYILNGIKDTLKVSGTGNKIKGSVVNAYTSAIKFDNTENNFLTISGSIINGGLDDDGIAIKGDSKNDELILEAGEIEFKNGSVEKINTVINGSIDLGEGDNKLTISEGTVINGEIIAGSGNNALTLGKGNLNRSAEQEEINIFNNIKGFDETLINGNVTIFDKTYVFDKELSVAEEKLTAELGDITLENGSNLMLKIDDTQKEGEKITGHALHGNKGSISSNGGKLLLDVGKLSGGTIINFGGTELTDSMKGNEINYSSEITIDSLSLLHNIEKISNEDIKVMIKGSLPVMPYPDNINYNQLNKVYQGILSTDQVKYFNIVSKENLSTFLEYLNNIYTGSPYSYSSELSRKSTGMFRDIVTDNSFKSDIGKWMIYGGLTHIDGGTKDTYYGKGYYTYDIGNTDMDADTKITGAYMLGEYGVSDTLTSGVIIGGNKLKSDISNGSKIDGSALYLGAYTKKYIGNLKVTAGAGFQYGDYNADRIALNKVASNIAESIIRYSDSYNDVVYDIYLNGRYSNPIGDNLFLEPYATLSYTYIDQDGANEGSKVLAIETDSKSFDYTVGKVGVDLKKVILHSSGKSTLTAGVSYTKILDGAEEKYITGRFKGGRDFDILVAHKNEHSIGLNTKYALELENGVIFDIKGTYTIERDSNNNSGKNKAKGEWIIGTGLGYKF
ncbi:autotransporter outer membrane beta-barrel domain-containing protein [Fusobacterium sp. THCT1E2]